MGHTWTLDKSPVEAVADAKRAEVGIEDRGSRLGITEIDPDLAGGGAVSRLYQRIQRCMERRQVRGIAPLRKTPGNGSGRLSLPTEQVGQICRKDVMPLRNRACQDGARIGCGGPGEIESRGAAAIGHFERGTQPGPEIVHALPAEIKIGKRPARLILTIDASGFQQPAFGRRVIAANFRVEAQANTRLGCIGIEPGDFFEQGPRVAAIVLHLERVQGKVRGVARREIYGASHALRSALAERGVGTGQQDRDPRRRRERQQRQQPRNFGTLRQFDYIPGSCCIHGNRPYT